MTITESVTTNPAAQTGWRQIGRNSVWLLLARSLGQVLGLVFSLLVARNLGEVVLGQFAFISTVLLIANMATNLGTDTIVIRQVATDATSQPDERPLAELLTSALLIQLALSSLVIVVIWLLSPLLPNQTDETLPAFRLISLSLISIALSSVTSAALRGREHMGLYLIFSLVTSVVLVLGAWVVVNRDGDLYGLALTTLVAQSAGALIAFVLFWQMRPSLGWRLVLPSTDFLLGIARTGVILALLMTVTLVIGRLGILALSLLADDALTGWFSAAARLVEGFKLIPAAVLGALFPMLARRHASRESVNIQTTSGPLSRLLVVGVGLSAVLAVLTTVLAEPIILLLYGPSFEPSIAVLRILVWALPFSVVSLSLSMWLVAGGQERVVLWALLPALGISAVVMTILINRFGLNGAAVGSVVAEAIQMVALLAALLLAPRP